MFLVLLLTSTAVWYWLDRKSKGLMETAMARCSVSKCHGVNGIVLLAPAMSLVGYSSQPSPAWL